MEWNKQRFLEYFDGLLRVEGGDMQEKDVKLRYHALCKCIMSEVHLAWERSKKDFNRRCGYFSAEFLIGRAIFSNLLHLGILDEVKDALFAQGIDIHDFEEVDDPALGNGGLGRLSACFLESSATQSIPMDGYGLRYRYGLFKQSFENGFQKEDGDDWLSWGDPWSVRRESERVEVRFADFSVYAVPYDMPVIGYKNGVVNTLRLWQSEPIKPFCFQAFDKMQGCEVALDNYCATQITAVLYPNDHTREGKLLRLRQEYLLVSASLQSMLKSHFDKGRKLADFPAFAVVQLNDTHPTLAIPELIRLLKKEGVSVKEGLAYCRKLFCFTNHTIMGEALEKWDKSLLKEILPEIWDILEELQTLAEEENLDKTKNYIVKDGVAHMANLAIFASGKVNGVAQIHTGILKEKTFKDWYEIYPDKFVNVTNGITPRRWLLLNNPLLAKEITERIGDGWHTDLRKIADMKAFLHDATFRKRFVEIKRANKRALAGYIARKEGVILPERFIFDTQIKRLHEYKRQLLNAFSILYMYNKLKKGELPSFQPTAFIFGAKSAPGYYLAKAVIKFINEIAKQINADTTVSDKLRVVFVQNYNVSYAEKIVCASDVSEQISTAGMEASGTGNMKFMLNGTVTLGTLDGANVEICEEAGKENNYIFGATVDEVARVKKDYNPKSILENDKELSAVVESLVNGSFHDGGSGMFQALYDSLLAGNEPDRYLVLYDFESYMQAKLRLNAEYGSEPFLDKCIINMCSAGKFSADRSVKEYAEKIWKI
ncbi:MAG: glycogen/starch/alpha-glucan family phosphorylase [Clostridia bacterium]|nr:glycogen/starch/alpha-glucan family phosphorylase [Clostridia bacterium]